jgi:hypothetical protein
MHGRNKVKMSPRPRPLAAWLHPAPRDCSHACIWPAITLAGAMKRTGLMLAALIASGTAAQAGAGAEQRPQYLQDLSRAYRAGDWVLQCDSSRICRILGVVRTSGRDTDRRAIIVISRGIEANAQYFVRFAFIDDHGLVLPPPAEPIWLYATGRPGLPLPLRLTLGPAEGEAEAPLYRVGADQAWRVVNALRRWPGAVLRGPGGVTSRMPRGDLAALLAQMDALQVSPASRMSAEEENQWMREYHYAVVRARPATGLPHPDAVAQSCGDHGQVVAQESWAVDADAVLWIAHCSAEAKIFMQRREAGALAEPVPLHVTHITGTRRPVREARFDRETSFLQLLLSDEGRWDCGTRVRYGYTDQAAFGVIEDRHMPLCRAIPAGYWLRVWSPTSWRYADAPPSDEGNALPPTEGVVRP